MLGVAGTYTGGLMVGSFGQGEQFILLNKLQRMQRCKSFWAIQGSCCDSRNLLTATAVELLLGTINGHLIGSLLFLVRYKWISSSDDDTNFDMLLLDYSTKYFLWKMIYLDNASSFLDYFWVNGESVLSLDLGEKLCCNFLDNETVWKSKCHNPAGQYRYTA